MPQKFHQTNFISIMHIRKLLLIVLFSLYSTVLMSQVTDDEPVMMFAGMNVTNLDSSAAWYERMLKLKTVDRADYPVLGYRQANLKGDKLQIELKEYDSAFASQEQNGSSDVKKLNGITAVGFSVRDFKEWVGHLLMQSARFTGGVTTDRTTGKPMMELADPDGNLIRIYEE